MITVGIIRRGCWFIFAANLLQVAELLGEHILKHFWDRDYSDAAIWNFAIVLTSLDSQQLKLGGYSATRTSLIYPLDQAAMSLGVTH